MDERTKCFEVLLESIKESLIIKFMSLTILTWKNLRFTEKIHWNTRLAASDVFYMFTQSIKFF